MGKTNHEAGCRLTLMCSAARTLKGHRTSEGDCFMQVVLQVVDENVARGSKVFETGHVSPSALCDLTSVSLSVWLSDVHLVQKAASQPLHGPADSGAGLL